MQLGQVIKRTRFEQGKTVKEIAEKAEITASLLSQIENHKANPSINSLMAISKALNVPIGSFFDAYETSESPVVTSYARRRIPTSDGVTFYLLTPPDRIFQ